LERRWAYPVLLPVDAASETDHAQPAAVTMALPAVAVSEAALACRLPDGHCDL